MDKKRFILGITGSFGSGKTTVARIFKSFGAKIIDADKLAHKCIRPENPAYKRIVNVFGKDILNKNRTINRENLARIVFNNKNFLKRLDKIIHPQVIRIIKQQINTAKSKIIVLDAPLLIEAGLRQIVDKIIVVKITRKKQIERIKNKTFLGSLDILKRIKSQISLSRKVRLADFVIDNSGTINKTRSQVVRIWKKLQPLKH